MTSRRNAPTIIADLHLHSPWSRAVSSRMTLPEMSYQAKRRGIDLLATGDWTHPQWLRKIEAELIEWQPGVFASRSHPDGAKFVLSTEISCIFSQGGRGRRIHLLVLAPSIAAVKKINAALTDRGVNLLADGRPIMGLSCQAISELVFQVDAQCLIIPAHAWTPWFGLYGSKGGFDSLSEAFGPWADQIYAIETGLSSDPLMNWRMSELDNRAIVSFSDAHSPAKMGREVTIFSYRNQSSSNSSAIGFEYRDIYQAIAERYTGKNAGQLVLSSTIEFYPEEGKYHWDGHRACGIVQSPRVTKERGVTCPVCGRPLTVGVEYRVEELASRPTDRLMTTSPLVTGVVWKQNAPDPTRPGFMSLVPLQEIIAEVEHKGIGTKTVVQKYDLLLDQLGSEFEILLQQPSREISSVAGAAIADAIVKVRRGELEIAPGYDGVYGRVKIPMTQQTQASLFSPVASGESIFTP